MRVYELYSVLNVLGHQRGLNLAYHVSIAAASETCSGGKEWQQCATACPLTCNNYDTAPVVCTESCIEGCVCPEGKVELDGVCVEPSTCTSKLTIILY